MAIRAGEGPQYSDEVYRYANQLEARIDASLAQQDRTQICSFKFFNALDFEDSMPKRIRQQIIDVIRHKYLDDPELGWERVVLESRKGSGPSYFLFVPRRVDNRIVTSVRRKARQVPDYDLSLFEELLKQVDLTGLTLTLIYASEDEFVAAEVMDIVEMRGAVALDIYGDMLPGEKIVTSQKRKLREADLIIPVVLPETVNIRGSFQRLVGYAAYLSEEFPNRTNIIPLVLDNCYIASDFLNSLWQAEIWDIEKVKKFVLTLYNKAKEIREILKK